MRWRNVGDSGLAATLVDFVENSFGESCETLGRLASERPGALLAQREAFYASMETTWVATGLDDVPPAASAELRPIYGRGLLSLQGTLSSYYQDAPDHSAMTREIKALLLYAHSTVVLNPLSPWFDLEDKALVTERRPDGLEFVRAVQTVAELAPLVRQGSVLIVEPPEVTWRTDVDVDAALAHVGRTSWRSEGRSWDQWDAFARAKDTLLRLLAYGALDPADCGDAIALSPSDTGGSLSEFIRVLAEHVDPDCPLPTEDARLAALLQLSLPDVDGLRPRDMVDVRFDDKFSAFRSDMRAALTEADQSLRQGELDVARRDVREHMAARAAELTQTKAKTRFWHAASSGVVGWSVGASLTSLAGWKSALLGLLARSAYDTAQARPSRQSRALLQHYVCLAQDHSQPKPQGGVASIRAWRQGRK